MGTRHVGQFLGSTARLHHKLLAVSGMLLPKRRGLRKITIILKKILGSSNSVIISHEHGFDFTISLSDPYWTPLLFSDYNYEPEVEKLISTVGTMADTFVDCGANKGFWTARCANLYKVVVSIEASPATFEELQKNISGANVIALNNAVYSKNGECLDFVRSDIRHGASYIKKLAPNWKNSLGQDQMIEQVETVTLDSITQIVGRTIIKLDVEGAEMEALKGARRLIADGAMIVYEDHGSDVTCEISEFIMHEMGMEIFYCGSGFHRFSSIDEIRSLKTNPSIGYNFVALNRTSLFIDVLNQ